MDSRGVWTNIWRSALFLGGIGVADQTNHIKLRKSIELKAFESCVKVREEIFYRFALFFTSP